MKCYRSENNSVIATFSGKPMKGTFLVAKKQKVPKNPKITYEEAIPRFNSFPSNVLINTMDIHTIMASFKLFECIRR